MIRSEYWLSAKGLPKGSVYLKRVAPDVPDKPPVLCVHGATIASTLFDAKDASLLEDLAHAGHPAYTIDLRGYAKSSSAIAGLADVTGLRATAVADDVIAALTFIRDHDASPAVSLIGASWGSVIAGHIATMIDPAWLNRLVLYAPLCDTPNMPEFTRLFGQPSLEDLPKTREAAYDVFWDRWRQEHKGVPAKDWIENTTKQDVMRSVFSSNPTAHIPNGCIADLAEVFRGKAIYDPAQISTPTLVLRGSKDPTSTRTGALSIFDRLNGSDSRFVEVAGAAHFGLLERRGGGLREAISNFLHH